MQDRTPTRTFLVPFESFEVPVLAQASPGPSGGGDIKNVKRFVMLLKFSLLLSAVGIVAWRFEPVREKVKSYKHDVRQDMGSVTGRTALDLGRKAHESLKRGNLERAMKQFESTRGRKPEDLQELVREGFLEKTDLVDEWGRNLRVEVGVNGVVVRGPGKDGRLHTRDDWVVGD